MSARGIRVNGRTVGEVKHGVFVKHVKGSVHFLRKPPAIAVDVHSLAETERYGAESVCIVDTETGREYCASIAHIRARGFVFNRGFGEQIALPLGLWVGPGEPLPEPESEAAQLTLWVTM